MSIPRKLMHGTFGRFLLAEMDAAMAIHAHPHYHILCKGRGPDVSFIVDGRLHALTADNVLVMKPWGAHALQVESTASTQVLAINLEPEWVRSRYDRAAAATGFEDLPVRSVALPPALRTSIRDVVVELDRSSGDGGASSDDLLDPLLDHIIQRAPGEGARPPAVPRVGDFRVRRALSMIRDLAPKELDFERVARECGLSRSHFFHQFREQTGVSPALYANGLRIEAAIEGLVGGAQSIKHLGMDIGFDAQSNFTRFFRERVGITPRDYRKSAAITV